MKRNRMLGIMNKLVSLILGAALILGMTACQDTTPKEGNASSGALAVQPGQSHTDMEGLELQLVEAVWEDGALVLTVDWVNATSYDATYGAYYAIVYYENGQWVSSAREGEYAFVDIAYLLDAGQTRRESYTVSVPFDVSKAGTYRFEANCYVASGAGAKEEVTLWLEFDLTDPEDTASVQAENLMESLEAGTVAGKSADDRFIASQMELAVKLFQASVGESLNENVLISPLSIQLALAMTANGAEGETKAEMEALLGGQIPLEELNNYLYSYVGALPSTSKCKLEIANSIWFRGEEDRLQVEQEFLQTNADYYGAQAYKSAFDSQTVRDINTWVRQHTDGMIDRILEEISENTVLYLINALVFDAEWQTVYNTSDIYNREFTDISGQKSTVEMMHSEEQVYLEDEYATGFMKAYQGGDYSFAALLPNEGVDIYDYISSLTGEGLQATLSNAKTGTVIVNLPKFSYEYELTMNDVLKELGMPTAFDGDRADFSNMATSSYGNIFIGQVLHKIFISVDELGTKAGAVTKVEMNDECAPMTEWIVTLDRPFVYMIVDNATDLPIFIGIVTEISE